MKGAAEGLGAQALVADLGMSLTLSVHADSSAAIGICRRSGIGRVRHLAVGQLWVQDHLRRGTFRLFKVRGSENPADLCTKHLTRTVIDELIEICGIVREAGRTTSAPELNVEAEPLPTKPKSGSSLLATLGFQCPADSCVLVPISPRPTHGPPRTLTHDEATTDLHVPSPTTRPPRITSQPATASRPHLTPLHFRLRFSRLVWRSSCA